MSQIVSKSEADTAALAGQLARELPRGSVVHLVGDLGAGKTSFVRALLRALGHEGRVKSPSYGLIEPYEIDGAVYHLDLYRLSDPEELEYLGLRDLIADHRLLLIEWPERGGTLTPAPDLRIEFAITGPQSRQISWS